MERSNKLLLPYVQDVLTHFEISSHMKWVRSKIFLTYSMIEIIIKDRMRVLKVNAVVFVALDFDNILWVDIYKSIYIDIFLNILFRKMMNCGKFVNKSSLGKKNTNILPS